MADSTESHGFRAKLTAGEKLVGTFIKTPAPHVVELAALSALDFVVLDAEHAPFSARDLDLCLLAGRAALLDVLVRIPSASPVPVQQALDLGAAGVVIPHVSTAREAKAMVRAARYSGGDRGYSNSPRAGGYGTVGMPTHITNSDSNSAVIIQIESPEAVDNVEEIAAVPGVDALFIGRADLAVAYGASSPAAPEINDIAGRIVSAANAKNLTVASFFADFSAYCASDKNTGSMLVIGSDQLMLKNAWTAAAKDVRAHVSDAPSQN